MRVMALETFFDKIKQDTKDLTIKQLRYLIRVNRKNEYWQFEHMHKLPRVFPAIELSKAKDGSYKMKCFNGIVLLDVNNLDASEMPAQIKQMAQAMPMTLAAFTGASGKSVKILVRVANTKGGIPQTEEEVSEFYRRAYRMAANAYSAVLPHPVTQHDISGSILSMDSSTATALSFRMTLDEEPYFNAKAMPMLVPDLIQEDHTQRVANLLQQANNGQQTDTDERISQETQALVNFIEQRYELRYNTVMGYAEYRPKKSLFSFMPVDDRTRYSFAMEARLAGLDVWDKDVNRYVSSKMIKNYDPVQDYLWRVHNTWDGKDRIRELARCVPTDNPHWEDWFYTWFLGMVAQWIGRNKNYGNSTAPLLISRQGYNKSTFCKSLIPNDLQWGYNDNLMIDEKKSVLQAMAQFLLINLDEFNAISPKVQEGFLKNVIQLANVKVKRPYGKHVEVFPRLASFIATANMTDILADPSGCRRFIGIELTGPIKINPHINYEQLYAQAFQAVLAGEPYWFDADQTALIMESNRRFQMQQPAQEVFFDTFDIDTDEQHGEYLTTSAILSQLKTPTGNSISDTNHRAFGRWLKNLDGLHHKDSNRGTKYLVRKKS